jgi:hypothetical protein
MEELKQSPLLKSTINYGAMLGLVLVIFTILSWMFDATTNKNIKYVEYLLVIAGIIIATRTFRDQEQGGSITYGRAFLVGMLTTIFAGVITSVFTYLLYSVIDPGLIDKTYAMMEEAYYNAGMSDAQIDQIMNVARRFANPLMLSATAFMGYSLMGVIFSLVTSIFLKKEGDPFATDIN